MAKIHVNYPNIAQDAIIDIPGYGIFANGYDVEVEDLEEDLYFPALVVEEPEIVTLEVTVTDNGDDE